MTTFVEMYHPLIPSTGVTPRKVATQAVDDLAARGWLEVTPSDPPVVVHPYMTQAAGDSRYVRDTELDQQAADVVAAGTGALPAALRAAYGRVVRGPTLPTGMPPGEYIWFQTDGAGTVLDILSGVAS